jgi:hypothetical protein
MFNILMAAGAGTTAAKTDRRKKASIQAAMAAAEVNPASLESREEFRALNKP